ncbi:hypothetical protein TNCT_493641 [Trichonephila clavata]|uniref:Uncharacterized protein n=1 Tax=Trichonephila clavata TaxID=2740835 RepID=A0A8X6KRK2_TRICU|nr:hypothetical protein TNCT_493641 [Trichonephila clavata]
MPLWTGSHFSPTSGPLREIESCPKSIPPGNIALPSIPSSVHPPILPICWKKTLKTVMRGSQPSYRSGRASPRNQLSVLKLPRPLGVFGKQANDTPQTHISGSLPGPCRRCSMF